MALKKSGEVMEERRSTRREILLRQKRERERKKRVANAQEERLRQVWQAYELGALALEIKSSIYGVHVSSAERAYPSFEWDEELEEGRLFYECEVSFQGEKDKYGYLSVESRPFSISLQKVGDRYGLRLMLRPLKENHVDVNGTCTLVWGSDKSKEALHDEIDREVTRLLRGRPRKNKQEKQTRRGFLGIF